MPRKAIIVAGAAGPDDSAGAVLQRVGFGQLATAATVAQAAARLKEEHFDLVIVPLTESDAVDLATLDREVRRSGSTYVIGTAARLEPELILRAMRTGIHEFLVHPPDPKEFAAAVDRLLRRGKSEVTRGTTIAVYTAKGGLGATTIAINLAHALAKSTPEGRVALSDLVVAGGDVGVLLDLRPAYTIADLVPKVDRIDSELLLSLLTATPSGVWVLPSGDRPEAEEVVDASAATAIIQQLRSHFAFTIFDCEHHLSDRTLAAMDAADRIVLVTQLNIPALRSLQRTLSVCDRLGYRDEKLVVVANRHYPADVVTTADAAGLIERQIDWKLPNDYRTASAAVTKGASVMETDPSSALARSFAGLASMLGGGLTTAHQNGRGDTTQRSRISKLFGLGRKS